MRTRLIGLGLFLLATAAFAEESSVIPGVKKVPQTLQEAKAEADRLEKLYAGKTQPEAVRMFIAIMRGSQMGSGEGWFGPAQTRYTWKWLADRCGGATKKGISRARFPGLDGWFALLDRDKNGRITATDLDWSDQNPWVRQSYLVNRLFRQLDPSGTGRVTKKDLLAFFDKASKGKDHLTSDDLRDVLLTGAGGYLPGDAPTPERLLRGLFAGEVGSPHEGPKIDDPAPDFTLQTVDRKRTVRLSEVTGKKPVVLVFGNFTCGPFRSMYPLVEEVQRRHGKEATFLMVYVREAHPTDGWRMKSNDRVGVAVAQPTTTEKRCAVAGQFEKLLKPTMPLLVDEVNDKVGHAYSGMPARLYVIDAKGKVAYKSGRGPFGFKVGEMEQALVMALLEAAPRTQKPNTDRGHERQIVQAAGWQDLLSGGKLTERQRARLRELARSLATAGNALETRQAEELRSPLNRSLAASWSAGSRLPPAPSGLSLHSSMPLPGAQRNIASLRSVLRRRTRTRR